MNRLSYGVLALTAALAAGCAHSGQSVVNAPIAPSAHRLTPDSSANVYVTIGDSLLTFRQSDNGDVAPRHAINGSGAGVPSFGGVTVAQNGDLYATDLNNSRIVAYPPSADGAAPALLTISCGGMGGPNSLVFDQSGHLYAANGGGVPFSVSVLPANASGCVNNNPIIVGLQTGLYNPQGISATGAGKLYVFNNNSSITEFRRGGSGDASPTHDIRGPHTGLAPESQCGDAVAIDAAGDIFAANAFGNSITVYAPNSDKDATPTRTIAGPLTELNTPRGVAVDASGDIFVANSSGASILVFGPGANGNVAPIRTISGPHTRLSNYIGGIALSR
jgi:hypothetical protein